MVQSEQILRTMMSSSKDGGIAVKDALAGGVTRSVFYKVVQAGELVRYGRGLYTISSEWEDDFLLFQRKYPRGLYSNATALYLLGYSERTPATYTMTFPKGYNASSLKTENLIVRRVVEKNYDVGVAEVPSPCGNPLRVYELERTLCDIVRGSGSETQIVLEALRRYVSSKGKNVTKLMQYAEQLRVAPKMFNYMRIML